MKKYLRLVFVAALSASWSSRVAAQGPSAAPPAAGGPLAADLKPKPWGSEPDAYTFVFERNVRDTSALAKEDDQKKVVEIIRALMKEHEYKDYEIFRIDGGKPAKQLDTYFVRFFKVKQEEEL